MADVLEKTIKNLTHCAIAITSTFYVYRREEVSKNSTLCTLEQKC